MTVISGFYPMVMITSMCTVIHGYSLKVTNLQATVGVRQLKKFLGFIEKRSYNWERLYNALASSKIEDKVILPKSGIKRNVVTKHVEDHNVQTRLLFLVNLIKYPCFDEIRGTDAYRVVGELDGTEYIMNNSFWIGVYPGMTDVMIDYMAEVIVEALS